MELRALTKQLVMRYCFTEAWYKFWNLSKRSRKTLKLLLINKRIILLEYNEKALKLNGWVQIGNKPIKIDKTEDLKKGILNYRATCQEHLDALLNLNHQLKCALKLKEAVKPAIFTFVHSVEITLENFEFYSNITFRHINEMTLIRLYPHEIKHIMKKVRSIDGLAICDTSLTKLNLSKISIRSLIFDEVRFFEKVSLPRFLSNLELAWCENLNMALVKNVISLKIRNAKSLPGKERYWMRRIKTLKEIRLDQCLTVYLKDLSPSVRKATDYMFFEEDYQREQEIKSRLPNLIQINSEIPVKLAENLKLREIYNTTGTHQSRFSIRPRRITVNHNNVSVLNNRPELFEKAGVVAVETKEFNLAVLPRKLKKICIFRVDLDS